MAWYRAETMMRLRPHSRELADRRGLQLPLSHPLVGVLRVAALLGGRKIGGTMFGLLGVGIGPRRGRAHGVGLIAVPGARDSDIDALSMLA